MNPELIKINEEQLFEFLAEKNMPVMEFDIIKHFVASKNEHPEEHTLFIKHFSIYHSLYKLKFSSGLKNYYLHLDCMRIRLIKIPEQGICRHYNPETGNFCGAPTYSDFCTEHEEEYKEYRNSASFDILQDFYTDPENITFGDSEILKKLMSGIKVYCFRKKDIDDALRFFDIQKPGRKIIANRYRELAIKYHPDKCSGSEDMMKKLNSSYSILKEVFIV